MAPDSFNDDRQSTLMDEVKAIAQGKLDKLITEEHELAIRAEHELLLDTCKPLPTF